MSKEMTTDINKLMTRWMKWYVNMSILRSTDPNVQKIMDKIKERLAELNEELMDFFDFMGAEPEV